MPRPATDIRDRIVSAARAEFFAQGVDAAALRAIAKKAHTSLGMIYYYYPSKDELFLAVLEEPYQKFLSRLSERLESQGSFEQRLTALYGIFAELSPLEKDTLKLVLREMLGSSERLSRVIERFQRGHLPLLVNFLGAGAREGLIRAHTHPALLLGLLGGVGILPQVLLELLGHRLPGARPRAEELMPALSRAFLRAVSGARADAKEPC
jgi:AcrR family transcriptional regulator